MRSITVFAFLFFFLDSCTLYPRYHRPCMEMPEQWRVSSDETDTVVNVRWWEQFQDPVLNGLIQEALEQNNDLRAATARIARFRARLGVVSSQLYPQLFAQGIASRQKASRTLTGEQIFGPNQGGASYPQTYQADEQNTTIFDLGQLFPIYSNDYQALLTASYELDLWGKIRSATRASYAELLGQINARRTVILSVVSSVAASYILLRQYQTQLKISRQTLQSRQESLKLARIRFEEGLTSELEVVQAAAEADEAEIQMIQFETLIPEQENLLSILMGHPPGLIQGDLSLETWQRLPEVPAGLPSDLLEQRPDIVQAEQELMAANFRIGEARALFFPDFTLTGTYGYQSSQLSELFKDPSRTWQWMVNLLQPLFTGGRILSTVDLAKAEKCEAAYNYLQVILTALKEVNDALISLQNIKKSVLVQLDRVKDLRQYLHLATLQYENGLVDYLNVLDAERRLFDAQLDLAQGQADVFITFINLYKALGGGWVVDAENLMKEE